MKKRNRAPQPGWRTALRPRKRPAHFGNGFVRKPGKVIWRS